MNEIIVALLVAGALLMLVAYADTMETGLRGIGEAFMGVWRTLDRLRRDGR